MGLQMNRIPHIAILLSSYNGEKFIEDQINSILRQEGVLVHLYIRDDSSTDNTTDILRSIAEKHQNITITGGKNIGVFQSFMQLLRDVDKNHDYYAFADQDDIWKSDKLETAANQLSGVDATIPAMYYGRLEFTDEYLNILGFSQIPENKGFHNALVQNQATGCTIVLNSKARDLICSKEPSWALMHDWWCYLVVSAFGKVFYDEIPLIYYRKHGNNVTPATPFFIKELYARTRRFLGHGRIPEKITDQARYFKELYGDQLPPDKQILLDEFLEARNSNLAGRIRYTMNMPVKRNTGIDNFILKILIIAGRF